MRDKTATSSDRLLAAIFGEKPTGVFDTSALWETVDSLPIKRTGDALHWRYEHNMTYREIGMALGRWDDPLIPIKYAAARNQVEEGLRRLRRPYWRRHFDLGLQARWGA